MFLKYLQNRLVKIINSINKYLSSFQSNEGLLETITVLAFIPNDDRIPSKKVSKCLQRTELVRILFCYVIIQLR